MASDICRFWLIVEAGGGRLSTFGSLAMIGTRMPLLNISEHKSNPPSIHKFLLMILIRATVEMKEGFTYRNAPAASKATSSDGSESSLIKRVTIFLACSSRRVEESFCMTLLTAAQAQVLSFSSVLSSYK